MRTFTFLGVLTLSLAAYAADVESRQLTHYVPQNDLEAFVRKEGWTEIPLNVKGGVRKGDVVRIWSGGSIDRGNGDHPSQFVAGPAGVDKPPTGLDPSKLAISADPKDAYALLFKTESKKIHKSMIPGKPLEIKVTKDKEQLWMGFNDESGRYHDNHIGKGRRHELDPLWVRIEVVRIIVD
jgi:hypothetical protein